MSANLRSFTAAVYTFDAVVQRTPDDAWDLQTPCADWNARELVAHQVGVLDGVADFAGGADPRLPVAPDPADDPRAQWRACREQLLVALDQEGALHHEDGYWFGPMSVDGLIGVVMWDPLTHAWDLGRTVGVDPVIDEELAAACLANVEANGDTLRKLQLIADPIEVPEGAGVVDRYLAAVGRDPAW